MKSAEEGDPRKGERLPPLPPPPATPLSLSGQREGDPEGASETEPLCHRTHLITDLSLPVISWVMLQVGIVLLVVVASVVAGQEDRHWSRVGFVRQRFLADGERERRLHFKRVTVIETSVRFPEYEREPNQLNSTLRAPDGLVLCQATDGRHFIQLIYEAGQLRDCEYIKDKLSVRQFLSRLQEDFDCAVQLTSTTNKTCDSNGNSTLEVLRRRGDLPPDLIRLLDYRHLRRQCRDLHRKVRQALDHRAGTPETKILTKRSLLYPGTKWCGSGTSASNFKELGYHAAADRCCRDHDFCPYTIEAWQTKYNYPNIRPYTVSHCDCDERLRACLKLAETAAANMVGRLFFNVIQTKCFKFKNVHKCAQRSWWGKCLKKQKQKEAFLKDALTF